MPNKQKKIEKNDISQNSPPRISLICVVLNTARYIDQAIKSIISQTYQHWELIVIDGASSDGTQAIVESYARNDSRIHLYSEPDEGPWDATEKGLAKARGEFIMIISGNDGFLDKTWFEKCISILDSDKSISLVWASTCKMTEDGKLWPEDINYSHFINKEKNTDIAKHIFSKFFKIIKDLITGSPSRKKFMLKKIFSKTAILKLNFFTRRKFKNGVFPQKENWFRYWLDTGTPFSEQPMCVAKSVFLDCTSRYPRGSHIVMNHIVDFHYNFNAKGYLSYYVPIRAGFGRDHSDSSGARIPEELFKATNNYLKKVLELRKKILKNKTEMVFVNRFGEEVLRKKFVS